MALISGVPAHPRRKSCRRAGAGTIRCGYEHDPETRDALDLLLSERLTRGEPGVFAPIRDTLLASGDYFMHLADLNSYTDAHARAAVAYANPAEWAEKAILNVAGSGRFSSDRKIVEYATGIWNTTPCPVP